MSDINWQDAEVLLEKNLRYIENSKKIYVDIEKLRHVNEEDYRIIACADGKGYTIEKKTNKGYVRMHSAYEPYREGQLLAKKLEDSKNEGKLHIRFGLGFGYLYNYLLPFVEKQGGEVIIYEPSYDVFNYFIRLFDISKLFRGYPVRLFVYENGDSINKIYPYAWDKSMARISSQFTVGYLSFFKDEIKKCINGIEQFFKFDHVNRNTVKFFGMLWVQNAIINFPYFFTSYGLDGFKDTLKDKPAILVSAGPSLNKNVQLLKEVQGKVFIGAAYSAIKTLEANGIKPDMFCAVDAGQIPYELSVDYDVSDVPYIMHTTMPRGMFGGHEKNNFIMFEQTDSPQLTLGRIVLDELGKTVPTIDIPGGSVAHVVASILQFMGASTIVMIGQDLAYTGGQHHSKEYLEGQSSMTDALFEEIRIATTRMVEDVHGGMIETDKSFEIFVNQFKIFAKSHEDDLLLVDATEGGARIEHTKIMTLREAIDTYMTEYTDPTFTSRIIDKAKANGFLFDDSEKTKIISTFKKMLDQCFKVSKLTDDAKSAAKKVLDLYRFNKIPTHKELRKPLDSYKFLMDNIVKNALVFDAINTVWNAEFEEALAYKREEEPGSLFYVRTTSATLDTQKENCEVLAEALKETLETLEKDGE